MSGSRLSRAGRFSSDLLFRRSDDYDLLGIALLVVIGTGLVAFVGEAAHGWTASRAGWTWIGATTSILAIASVPIAYARLLARAELPAKVASAIGTARDPRLPGPNDDERDDGAPR